MRGEGVVDVFFFLVVCAATLPPKKKLLFSLYWPEKELPLLQFNITKAQAQLQGGAAALPFAIYDVLAKLDGRFYLVRLVFHLVHVVNPAIWDPFL